jgi:5-methylcytosine-specific restriction endonuclease McrA
VKRSPLKRKTPLTRGRFNLIRSWLNRGTKRLAWRTPRAELRQIKLRQLFRQLIGVRGDRCEFSIPGVCKGTATDACHIEPRDYTGANDTAENIKLGCRECHRYATDHPEEAYANGWAKKRNGVANV